MDGQGGTVEDFINTHGWWCKETGGDYGASLGTTGSLEWTPPTSGTLYIIKKMSDDEDPVVTHDDAAYCYMKFDVRDVDYVTVTPDPGYVAVVGGTIQLTGHAWDDNGTPGNTADDIELAATFDWTVDPALGTFDPASGKQTTLTAGANPSSCTVTATHQPSSEAGTATVYVVEVESVGLSGGATAIDDGSATPAKTDICAAIKASGDVVVQAVLDPAVTEADLPDGFVTWTGGDAVEGHQLQRKVSKSSWAKHTLTASCGNSSATMLAYVIGADPTGYSPGGAGTSGSHFSDNSEGFAATGITAVNPSTGYTKSMCEIEFTVKPNVLVSDGNANLFDTSKILWDVSRDKRVMKWTKVGGVWSLVDNRSASWASDDTIGDSEEDNDPWDGNGHLYGNDSPENIPGATQAYVKKLNMREWVRVGLGGTTGRNGTRCSAYSYWHCFRSLKKDGTWANDNTYGNEIPATNVFWGTIPVSALEITTTSPPDATLNHAYSQTLTSTGGTAPIAWNVDEGSLPPGLSLSTEGTISGTPTETGTFDFAVEAQDSSTPDPEADVQSLSITVNEE